MNSAAYASDGGSSTESEDETQIFLKSEPNYANDLPQLPAVAPLPDTNIKPEPQDDRLVKDEKVEMKSEQPIAASVLATDHVNQPQTESTSPPCCTTCSFPLLVVLQAEILATDHVNQPQTESTSPPCCTTCSFPLLVVLQAEILEATEMLDCKCCLLVLPDSSYSKTQRTEARKNVRKCKACTGNVARAANPKKEKKQNKAAVKRKQEAGAVFTNKVGRLKMAKDALQRKRDEAAKLKMTKRREEYEQQLDREEKDLERQSALLKRENPSAFQNLMTGLKIAKPPTYEQDRKNKAKKAKKVGAEKKQRSKRKMDAATATEQAKKKKTKGPVVDSSVYVPPTSAADEVPARVVPTRSRTKSQPETVQVKTEVKAQPEIVHVKAEVKTEQVKVEPKMG